MNWSTSTFCKVRPIGVLAVACLSSTPYHFRRPGPCEANSFFTPSSNGYRRFKWSIATHRDEKSNWEEFDRSHVIQLRDFCFFQNSLCEEITGSHQGASLNRKWNGTKAFCNASSTEWCEYRRIPVALVSKLDTFGAFADICRRIGDYRSSFARTEASVSITFLYFVWLLFTQATPAKTIIIFLIDEESTKSGALRTRNIRGRRNYRNLSIYSSPDRQTHISNYLFWSILSLGCVPQLHYNYVLISMASHFGHSIYLVKFDCRVSRQLKSINNQSSGRFNLAAVGWWNDMKYVLFSSALNCPCFAWVSRAALNDRWLNVVFYLSMNLSSTEWNVPLSFQLFFLTFLCFPTVFS